MSMLIHDILEFHFRDEGHGLPFVFQHGLGGDVTSRSDSIDRPPAFADRLTCAGMAKPGRWAIVDKLTIATLADDLIALLDHLEINARSSAGSRWGRRSPSMSRCGIPSACWVW